MDPKLLTISGYRGIVDKTFTNEAVEKLVTAFCKIINSGTVLVCRDGRPGGQAYLDTAVKVLGEQGFTAINGEILPTPLALFAVTNFKLNGAIIISASHNPIEYNGLKFVGSDGLFISAEDIGKIKNLLS